MPVFLAHNFIQGLFLYQLGYGRIASSFIEDQIVKQDDIHKEGTISSGRISAWIDLWGTK
jgi:hypothetical protein